MTIQTVRDVVIIIMGIITIGVGIGALVLIWQGWKLFGLVRGKIDLLTGTANDILGTVKETAQATAKTAHQAEGTAEFVADRAARPVIELYSAIAGAQRFAEAVFRHRQHSRNGGDS